jgi:hypothetical protein
VAAAADAAQYFDDQVLNGIDYTESVQALFYLDTQVQNLESVLASNPAYEDGSEQLQTEMRAARFYVNQLLYTYRASY